MEIGSWTSLDSGSGPYGPMHLITHFTDEDDWPLVHFACGKYLSPMECGMDAGLEKCPKCMAAVKKSADGNSEMSDVIALEAVKWLNGLGPQARAKIFKSAISASLRTSLQSAVDEYVEEVVEPKVKEEVDKLFDEGWRDSGVRHGSKVTLADYVARSVAVQLNTQLARMTAKLTVRLTKPPKDGA